MIKDNIRKVKERIEKTCLKIGCNPSSINIVAISKGRAIEEIKEVIEAGITNIGENRVQEASIKHSKFSVLYSSAKIKNFGKTSPKFYMKFGVTVQRSEVNQGVIPAPVFTGVNSAGIQRGHGRMDARFHGHDKNGRRELPEAELLQFGGLFPVFKWHMVGHLQINKVKNAVRIFDLIQSVDSLCLAQEIDKQAKKIDKIQDILIEIKTSPEETKFGLNLDKALEAIKEIDKLKNINLKGLMTIAPIVCEPDNSRPYFRMLKELFDRINRQNRLNRLNILSMGMTDDYEAAIGEGSNMLRLGRAIFEG
ncbi:MAG: YggS family pyridoxal phosphate-dependent enzyme [Candidatus Omnitrophota bacterium]|nr:YggS family pyridoxal phosphate-dependent enzyme [Candidatus Omnitrophota bacterium]